MRILVLVPTLVRIGAGTEPWSEIPELNGNLVICKGEELLSQTIALLLLPFLCQKALDCSGTSKEGGSIAPFAVRGVGLSDRRRISSQSCYATTTTVMGYCLLAIPKILGLLYFRVRRLSGEWWGE